MLHAYTQRAATGSAHSVCRVWEEEELKYHATKTVVHALYAQGWAV